MIPFLKKIASLYYEKWGKNLSNCCFVFPSQRAGVFFQHYLSQMVKYPILAPERMTISDFFAQFSPLVLTDRITLLFHLYKAYQEVAEWEESFDEFVSWGDMILNDFNDIDKHLAPAQEVYALLVDTKEIEQEFDFLTEEQKSLIAQFWRGFSKAKDKAYRKDFLKMWKLLFPLYEKFRENLRKNGLAYEGMLLRDAVEEHPMDFSSIPYERVVFVGLNALTRAEKKLMLSLQKEGKGDFYWDSESPFVKDEANRASFFIKQNKKMFPSLYEIEEEEFTMPKITLIGVPSITGQAKQIFPLLQELLEENANNELQTAVILPDEQLLFPLLRSIPKEYEGVNVTMGYPLKNTPVVGLMKDLIELQQFKRNRNGEEFFHFSSVLKLLSHPYLCAIAPQKCQEITKEIQENNKLFLLPSELQSQGILEKVFIPLSNDCNPMEYLMGIVQEIIRTFLPSLSPEEQENSPEANNHRSIESESLHTFYLILSRINNLGKLLSIDMRMETWFLLLKRLVQGETIPYEGEPLSGLQVMGILETRSLDFENVILPSMNEDIFPSRSFTNSFIPYNLREAWELPTYKYQDSIWAYHFYHLISRAKRVFLLYNTCSEGLKSGEVSRYVQQLRYLYKVPIKEENFTFQTALLHSSERVIEKNEEVQRSLMEYLTGKGKKSLSASAINCYLNCPFKFYLSYILGIQEDKEVEENIEAATFGSLFHRVMEKIYTPLKGREITSEMLKHLLKNDLKIRKYILEAFAEICFHSNELHPLEGNNQLVEKLIFKYVKETLKQDANLGVFSYWESEHKMIQPFPLEDGTGECVNLKGVIDRIDEVGGKMRIVDYKSGVVEAEISSLKELFEPQKKHNDAVFQLLFYSLLYALQRGNRDVSPSVYALRKLFLDFSPTIKIRGEEVKSFTPYYEEYLSLLRSCLKELFDMAVPFSPTPFKEHCKYCFFKGKCCK